MYMRDAPFVGGRAMVCKIQSTREAENEKHPARTLETLQDVHIMWGTP